VLKKKIWANFQRIIELFTKKIVKKLFKIWSWDPGSEIRDPEKTDSGSRIQGSTRHRIPDPDPQHCCLYETYTVYYNNLQLQKIRSLWYHVPVRTQHVFDNHVYLARYGRLRYRYLPMSFLLKQHSARPFTENIIKDLKQIKMTWCEIISDRVTDIRPTKHEVTEPRQRDKENRIVGKKTWCLRLLDTCT
jgi:hypothetical protein